MLRIVARSNIPDDIFTTTINKTQHALHPEFQRSACNTLRAFCGLFFFYKMRGNIVQQISINLPAPMVTDGDKDNKSNQKLVA